LEEFFLDMNLKLNEVDLEFINNSTAVNVSFNFNTGHVPTPYNPVLDMICRILYRLALNQFLNQFI
jgi:hypothetical protein